MRVAPFKAQNMANNAFATLEGGEIGVAQAVQAEACGLRPRVEMNPILLKPNGPDGSQIVRLGVAGETLSARNYYDSIDESWRIVRETLDGWKRDCDVLVMEGAGSPVELNLMERDIVNLRPVEYVDGRWLLVSNIEFGGVFAQVIGTWGLLPEAIRRRGLGFVVNRFRGDIGLFDAARGEFESRMRLPYLGVIPFEERFRIEDEDSLNACAGRPRGDKPYFAWVKYPQVSNTQDQLPWLYDEGIDSIWTTDVATLEGAAGIILPGTKNTLADLEWLKKSGLAKAILQHAGKAHPVVGICGGLQMLGRSLLDPQSGKSADGLYLLPIHTEFRSEKTVVRNESAYAGDSWETFEIHTGASRVDVSFRGEALFETREVGERSFRREGLKRGNIWGTYQHGLFESAKMRERLLEASGISGCEVSRLTWQERRASVYDGMADFLDRHLDLESVKRYLEL